MASIVVFKGGRALSNDVARQGAKDAAIGFCWHTDEGRPVDDGIVVDNEVKRQRNLHLVSVVLSWLMSQHTTPSLLCSSLVW